MDQDGQDLEQLASDAIFDAGGMRGLSNRFFSTILQGLMLWWVSPSPITPVKWFTGADLPFDSTIGDVVLLAAIILQSYVARRLSRLYITVWLSGEEEPQRGQVLLV